MSQDEVKKGWILKQHCEASGPENLADGQMIEVMFADGSVIKGLKIDFDWSWKPEEENRISQYRLLSQFATMTADQLMTFIATKKKEIGQMEAEIASGKLGLRTAMGELNRRLSEDCGVTLNEVMKPTGLTTR
ncbi:hypothetical protein [Pantoea phage Nafs113]|nr:hypothetical protein [Pantoea phage Nafs113]